MSNMYTRKIKLLGKKKPKVPNSVGSSWGPRVALYEREKTVSNSKAPLPVQPIHVNNANHTSVNNQNTYTSSGGGSLYTSRKSQPFTNNTEPQILKKVSTSSSIQDDSNNYIYNYARKVSSSSRGTHNKASSSTSSHRINNGVGGGTTYIIGGSNSSSHMTLSGSTIEDTMSQPLTLIIPPEDRLSGFESDFEESSRYTGLDRSQDSFPSTRTYQSSDDESHLNETPKTHFPKKLTGMADQKYKQPVAKSNSTVSGILKVSSTNLQIHNEADNETGSIVYSSSTNNCEPETMKCLDSPDTRDVTESNNLNNNENVKKQPKSPEISNLKHMSNNSINDSTDSSPKSKTGSTISSLAHGITMVYVPMESLPRSKSAAALNASLEYDPELSVSVKEIPNELSPESPSDFPQTSKDPDNDSLLESFDSIMFKPKDDELQVGHSPNGISPGLPSSTCSPIFSRVDIDMENQRELRRNSDIPPPLPPKNPIIQNLQSKLENTYKTRIHESQKDKNIRAAVESLENIINPNSKPDQLIKKEKNAKAKRVTLTLPGEIIPIRHEVMLNWRNENEVEVDAYSSTFLTCGHVLKDDDYSTMSSTRSGGLRGDTDEISSNSPTGGDQRSVLQQLRELSILIGGENCVENDKIFTEIRNNKDNSSSVNNTNSKSFRLHDKDSKRKTSDATVYSADSGKGSGSGSGSSPKSDHSSPGSENLKIRKSSTGSSQSQLSQPCEFRSDCNECILLNKPVHGFPSNSEELCSNAVNDILADITSRNTNTLKRSTTSKLLRRKSIKDSKSSSTKSSKSRKKKPLILDYCDCSFCDAVPGIATASSIGLEATKIKKILKSGEKARKISTGSSSSSSSSVKLNRSVAFRNSTRSSKSKSSPPPLSSDNNSPNNILFTIEEAEESPSMDSKANKIYSCKPQVAKFNVIDGSSEGDISVSKDVPHWHPNCWLAAADPQLGWSDLESLYSLNMKNDKPLSINGECWTCWQEISEIKRNSENPNGTVDRTKRMFIWLNKRHKEFQAPWWEAKKQASIRWVMTKALSHVPKEYLIDPFKESKKAKPSKYRLREEVIKGLLSGKLYSLALVNLYRETLGGTGYPSHGLNHWDIIKILSRRGIYSGQPSDMKLTEGTLRDKPIRMAAHIALIEAIMCLYSKEILARERIIATLHNFGCTVKPETTSPEKLVIAWINAAVITLKTYIMSTRNHQLSPEKQNRWLQLPQVGEIRDLCDGVGICSLFAIYCSNDMKLLDIGVPDPGETLTIYDSITNHSLIQKLCEDLFPETIYHLCVTDFLYIHGYMKQNILCFLVDLFIHLEVNPTVRVNRLTHVPIRIEL